MLHVAEQTSEIESHDLAFGSCKNSELQKSSRFIT